VLSHAQGGKAPVDEFVGSEACKECHSEIYSNFANTPHWKTSFDARGGAAGKGCESCHGPGREHVQSGGDPAKIVSFRGAERGKVVERCLACHQYGLEHGNFLRSAHKSSAVICLDCHSAHHFTQPDFLLVKPQPDLCYGCHAEQQAEFSRPYHHRVDEKLIRCTDCHNQHGGPMGRQLRTSAAQNAVCLNCHTETAGPFVYEHAPLRAEGCTSCHVAHGSVNPRMLKVSEVNLLCLSCHTVTFGSMTRDAPGFHDQSAQFQACTLCHTSIHGSNFSRGFFR